MRKFYKVERVKDIEFNLPKRSTVGSAGYDFECIERVEIPPMTVGCNPTLIMTGVKAEMPHCETLLLFNRSSNPKKKKLVLANGVGVIDSDYYNNPDNEGEIGFPFYNISNETVVIEKGDKLGQGVFVNYGIVVDDEAEGERVGGFGSTGK